MLEFLSTPTGAWIYQVVLAIVLFAGAAFASERGVELIKVCLRKIAEKIPFLKFAAPKGIGSFLLALVPAVFIAFDLDFNPLKDFAVFQNLDANLVNALVTAIIWFSSNVMHDKMPKSPKVEAKNYR